MARSETGDLPVQPGKPALGFGRAMSCLLEQLVFPGQDLFVASELRYCAKDQFLRPLRADVFDGRLFRPLAIALRQFRRPDRVVDIVVPFAACPVRDERQPRSLVEKQSGEREVATASALRPIAGVRFEHFLNTFEEIRIYKRAVCARPLTAVGVLQT
ncbi:MAG: hypothetical protein HRF49_07405 [bacterium]